MWKDLGAELNLLIFKQVAPKDESGCLVSFKTLTYILRADIPIPQLLKDNEAKSNHPQLNAAFFF